MANPSATYPTLCLSILPPAYLSINKQDVNRLFRGQKGRKAHVQILSHHTILKHCYDQLAPVQPIAGTPPKD